MQKLRDNSYYRERAEECRTIADMMHEEPRGKMLKCAEDYEKMAACADELLTLPQRS